MPRKPRTRAPYIMVADTTWALARADYLGGMTAQQVADKHGIGLHNLRQTMARKGWTKRALAEAHAAAGPGGPPVTAPAPAPAPAAAAAEPDPAAASGDLPATVLARARAALTAGRGAEATALLKAMREYVLVSQEVEEARSGHRREIEALREARPEAIGALEEAVVLQTLYGRWCGLGPEEQMLRMDPGDESGALAALDQLAPGWREERGRKR